MTVDIESIGKVTLGPDDVVVVRCESLLSQQQASRIKAKLEDTFQDNKVVVLQGGESLAVVMPQYRCARCSETLGRSPAQSASEFASKREFKLEDVKRWMGLDAAPAAMLEEVERTCQDYRDNLEKMRVEGLEHFERWQEYIGLSGSFDGKPLPSTVERLKAKVDDPCDDPVGVLLEVVDEIALVKAVAHGGWFLPGTHMSRLNNAANQVQQRRHECLEPMDGHR